MAVPAYSTPARVAQHRHVTRTVAIMRGAQAPADESEGLGCIVIRGEPVFFRAGVYPREGDPVVVVFGDGRVEVATMPARGSHWRSAHTPNVVMIPCDKPYGRGARVTGEEATLIGIVRK